MIGLLINYKMEVLSNNNFIEYCLAKYENVQYVTREEFDEDIDRIKYIRKLITRYQNGGELKYRLILNHIVILSNLFDPDTLSKILYFKLEDIFEYIKPFLDFLGILPRYIINDRRIDTSLIIGNKKIIEILKEV